jgi:CubicO group peptidase (beta-lactamase class C family)
VRGSGEAAWAPVREALEGAVREGVCSAAVLWTAHQGETAFHAAAGRLGMQPDAPPAHAETAFDLASLTKPLCTATCLMGLVAEGRVGLDDPVASHLPGFARGPDAARRGGVTVADLLAHASGLPAWRPYFEAARRLEGSRPGFAGSAAAREWLIAQVCAEPLEAAPGTRGVYSDLGYILLGELVARVSGRPLEAAFAEAVAKPLGLARTAFNPGNALPGPFGDDVADTGAHGPGMVHDDNAFTMGGVAGHAGLFGTAADVGRWAQGVLDTLQGRGAFPEPAVVRRFLAPPARVAGSTWVLGMDTPSEPCSGGPYMGPKAVGHLGFTGTSVWIEPEREWVVVLLTNRVLTDLGGEGIRRFRPLLHAAAGRALFGGPAPARAGCTAPAGSPDRPAGP